MAGRQQYRRPLRLRRKAETGVPAEGHSHILGILYLESDKADQAGDGYTDRQRRGRRSRRQARRHGNKIRKALSAAKRNVIRGDQKDAFEIPEDLQQGMSGRYISSRQPARPGECGA